MEDILNMMKSESRRDPSKKVAAVEKEELEDILNMVKSESRRDPSEKVASVEDKE